MAAIGPGPAIQREPASGVVAVAEAPLPTGSSNSAVTSPPACSSNLPEVQQSAAPLTEGGSPRSHTERSFLESESRDARSRSFAMAPPLALQRRGSLPPNGTLRAAQRESVAVDDNSAPVPEKVEPRDDAVNAEEQNEVSDMHYSENEDIVEYTVESPSGSQEYVLSDDETHVETLTEQEEGTLNPVLHSFFDAPVDEKVGGAVALSPEDAYYDGQSHPRRRTASTDSAALVQRLSLSHIPSEPADTVIKSGFLKKRSPTPSVGWKIRWFVLKDKRLMYFRNVDDVVPAGRIDLTLVKIKIQCLWNPGEFKCGLLRTDGSTVQLPQAQGRMWMELLCCGGGKRRLYATGRDPAEEVRCRVKPVGSTRVFELAGPYLELVDWIDKLNQVAKTCRIRTRHMVSVSQQKGFWKVERISPVTFSSVVGTGDILLFRTKVLNAALQRAITRGTYDHVALLLRSFEGQILIFESMGDTGVILTPWELFLKSDWFTAYRKIVLRRLRWPRTAERLDRLLAFIKRVTGRSYELSIAKLISKRKSEKEGGYFCSELVAAALQEIGALPASAVSSRFWPESFAARSNLKLCNGYELEEELLVDFTLERPSGGRGSRKKERPPQLKGRTLRSTVAAGKIKNTESPEEAAALTDMGVEAERGLRGQSTGTACQSTDSSLVQQPSLSNV